MNKIVILNQKEQKVVYAGLSLNSLDIEFGALGGLSVYTLCVRSSSLETPTNLTHDPVSVALCAALILTSLYYYQYVLIPTIANRPNEKTPNNPTQNQPVLK